MPHACRSVANSVQVHLHADYTVLVSGTEDLYTELRTHLPPQTRCFSQSCQSGPTWSRQNTLKKRANRGY